MVGLHVVAQSPGYYCIHDLADGVEQCKFPATLPTLTLANRQSNVVAHDRHGGLQTSHNEPSATSRHVFLPTPSDVADVMFSLKPAVLQKESGEYVCVVFPYLMHSGQG